MMKPYSDRWRIVSATFLSGAFLSATLTAAVLLARVAYADPPGTAIDFQPIDTSRLMGSPDPMPLEAVRVFPNLSFERPLEFTFAPDDTDRVFVVEQRGVIHVFPNRNEVGRTRTFLDIRDVVSRQGNEEGLLGLAFHPDYATNGEFYV